MKVKIIYTATVEVDRYDDFLVMKDIQNALEESVDDIVTDVLADHEICWLTISSRSQIKMEKKQ